MTTITIASLWINDISPVLRTSHQLIVVICLSQRFCHLSYSKVVEGIFESTRCLFILMESFFHSILQGDIAIFQITLKSSASHTVLIVFKRGRCLKGILTHTLIGLFSVEIADSFDISISQDHTTMITNHCCCIGVPAREDR